MDIYFLVSFFFKYGNDYYSFIIMTNVNFLYIYVREREKDRRSLNDRIARECEGVYRHTCKLFKQILHTKKKSKSIMVIVV